MPSRPSEAVHDDAVEQRDVGSGEDGATQDPLEGRAPARQHHEVLVAGLGGRIVDGVGEPDRERPVGRAGGVEGLEDVREAVPEEIAQPGEHGVGVTNLGRAPAIPLERLVGVVGQGRAVPLEHDDLVALPGKGQRRAQPADTGTDDHDPHGRQSGSRLALTLGGC